MASASKLAEFGKKHIARGIGRSTELVIEKGKGTFVWTVDGKKYLDLTTGIGVTSTGHCHPTVVKAVQEQAGQLTHGQVNIFYQRPMLELIDKLIPKMPSSKLDTFFFWNSGSEAVEAAIKVARHATKKQNIIVFQGSYHGRTFGTMALTTSKTVYSAGFAPLMPGVHVAPYPYFQQWAVHQADPEKFTPEWCGEEALHQLELLLKQRSDPRDTAAILVEPIQGEGGYVVPPKNFLIGLRRICDKHGILLICDEVQSGFGRTGKMFAVEHFDIVPDIMVMAKGIASGYPLSAIVSRKEIMDLQPPGSMGGTYSGNVIACAAAKATLDVFNEENLLANCNARSEQFFKGLKEKIPELLPEGVKVDIRGKGLMIGIEFMGVPYGFASKVAAEALKLDTIILTTSIYETLRLIPPLNITKEEVDLAIEKVVSSIAVAIKNL
ncbi:pyridoxal phosphate-dependent transferase [Cokeromyces recurvatus]|uniref:pyridoxal phosphate-dependent transferase n=1 Tax=Cokeromyces recurvatus TaxID=90255 RepID=UPI00222041F2|nr:pyridoxal phosphate-dependent transferase [Cokeromyces recurvatus]KAI7903589.1 pyridoxal phosphate-dependent transferase [Cokeromyces recurvatus]